jgi:hypothetical protein
VKFIGLLMINGEDDILEDTLAVNAAYCDAIYVLDGTQPNGDSYEICRAHRNMNRYTHEDDEPFRARYGYQPRDGWRQHLYEQATDDYGFDNYFLLLHGDEVWTADPRPLVTDDAGLYIFLLPFYFPREGEPWDDSRGPLEQLHWNLGPGYPEVRMFRGHPHVSYDPRQHFNVTPQGVAGTRYLHPEIQHYPYRSPDMQRARAAKHAANGFDPANYQHVLDGDHVYWSDAMIADYQAKPHGFFVDLRYDAKGAAVGSPASAV